MESSPETLKGLLTKVEVELRLLDGQTRSLEALCWKICDRKQELTELQNFDLVSQSLLALAQLIDAISEDPALDRPLYNSEVVEKIHLGDMIARLKSQSGTVHHKAKNNKCELF